MIYVKQYYLVPEICYLEYINNMIVPKICLIEYINNMKQRYAIIIECFKVDFVWTALTWYIGMNQHFRPNMIKANIFELLL